MYRDKQSESRSTKRWGSFKVICAGWLLWEKQWEKQQKKCTGRKDRQQELEKLPCFTNSKGNPLEVKFHRSQEVPPGESIKQTTLEINVLKQYPITTYHEYMGPLGSCFWSSGPGSLDLGRAPPPAWDQREAGQQAGSFEWLDLQRLSLSPGGSLISPPG